MWLYSGALHAQGERNFKQGKQNAADAVASADHGRQNAADAVASADHGQQHSDTIQERNRKNTSRRATKTAVFDNPHSEHSAASNHRPSAASSMHTSPEPCDSDVTNALQGLTPSSVAKYCTISGKSTSSSAAASQSNATSAEHAVKDSVIGLLQELDGSQHTSEDLWNDNHSSAPSLRLDHKTCIGILELEINNLTDMLKLDMPAQDALWAVMQQKDSAQVQYITMVRLLP